MTPDPMAPPVLRGPPVETESAQIAGADGSSRSESPSESRGARPASARSAPRAALWLPRNLHPIAWWLWALGLVVAASRTSNPLLLGLILAVAGLVVVRRRGTAPWARAFRYYLIFGAVIVVIRVGSRIFFGGGGAMGTHVLFTLPSVPVPSWAAGIAIGGPVTAESVLAAAYDGLRLATIIACIGAANALANPKRALRVLPGALYELGVAIVIAITVVPQLIAGVQRVRRARQLRGGVTRGVRALGTIALPVLHDSLDRSLALAAAMDSRGYGRRGAVPPSQRRATVGLLVGGLGSLVLGVYGLLGGSASAAMAFGVTGVGVAACIGGLALGSRRVRHTEYAPDPWDIPESLVAASGSVCAVAFVVVTHYGIEYLHPSLSPLAWPTLPLGASLAVLLAVTPAFTAPRPPRPRMRAPSSVPSTSTVQVTSAAGQTQEDS